MIIDIIEELSTTIVNNEIVNCYDYYVVYDDGREPEYIKNSCSSIYQELYNKYVAWE